MKIFQLSSARVGEISSSIQAYAVAADIALLPLRGIDRDSDVFVAFFVTPQPPRLALERRFVSRP